MKTNTVEMKNGKLELMFLFNGRVVCGVYTGEKTYTHELIKGLKRAGINGGYIENCISMQQSGEIGQLPLAKGFIEQDPGKIVFLFEKQFSRKTMIKSVKNAAFQPLDLLQPVKKGDVLVKTMIPPGTVMKYPDGKTKVLKNSTSHSRSFNAGAHTKISGNGTELIAEIDGSASRTALGDVSVYPVTVIKSAGKAHGHLYYESALKVEADIRAESNVETVSNLYVQGMIRSSQIYASGNIQCQLGFDNPKKLETASAYAGQSISTRAIRNYTAWAGKYIISETTIERSKVQTLHTVVTPLIKASEVRAGNKIYTRDITESSRIYLGSYFIDDMANKELYSKYLQHEKRLHDIETELVFLKEKLQNDRAASFKQLTKLKRISPQMIPADVILNRYFSSLGDGIKNLGTRISLYEKQADIVARDRIRIAFYEKQSRELMPVELIVTGTLSAGTVIYAANETLHIKENLTGVCVRVEEMSGKLITEKLNI